MGLKQFFRNVRHLGNAKLDQLESRSQAFNLLSPDLAYYLNNLATSNVDYGNLGAYGPSAMRVSTVFICVLVNAEGFSTLPVNVMQSTPEGSKVAYNHPAYQLIHNKPNPFQTASSFWKSVVAYIQLNGNAYAIIRYSGRFQPTRIDLIGDPEGVTISMSDSGKPIYTYKDKQYQDYEILHFKDLTFDGVYGVSRIRYNAETIGYAKKLKQYGSNAIGVKPPGYFTTEQNFDAVKKQEANLSKTWKDSIANGDTPLIPFGLKYMNLMIPPGDAQYLDSIGATKEDIYGIFRVPPTLAQNYERATFANAEQQDLVYTKYTMLPIITNIEQECNAKLYAEGNAESANPYYTKVNVNAFMRGDFKTRTEGYRTLWERGLISGNMVADLEDWNHYEGGDRRFIPMNMIPLDKVDEFVEQLTAPKDTNVADQGGNPQERGINIEKLLNGKVNGHAN